MADFTKFRTSVGGFNRTDVTGYIEKLCAEHQKEIRKLEEEKELLSAGLTAAKDALADQQAKNDALQKQLEETETALASTETALEEALTMALEQEAANAEAEKAETPDYASMELEAYRRAEATERLANERADQLRQNLSDLLDNVASRYEETGQEIQALNEDIRTSLKRLEDALSDLDVIFNETTGSFDTLDRDEQLSD